MEIRSVLQHGVERKPREIGSWKGMERSYLVSPKFNHIEEPESKQPKME